MISKRTRVVKILLAVTITLFAVMNSQNASAETDYSSVLDKWRYTQFYQCTRYSGAQVESIKVDDVGTKKVIKTTFYDNKDKNGNTIAKQLMPSYNLAGDSKTDKKCYTVAEDILGRYKVDSTTATDITWKTTGAAESLMADGLKYSKGTTTGKGNKGYFTIIALRTTSTEAFGGLIPISSESDWDDSSARVDVYPSKDNPEYTTYEISSGWDNAFAGVQIQLGNGQITLHPNTGGFLGWLAGCSAADDTKDESFDLYVSMYSTFGPIESKMINKQWTISCRSGATSGRDVYRFGEKKDGDGRKLGKVVDSSEVTQYTWTTSKAVSELNALSNGKYASASSLYLSKTEFYNLYSFYISKAVPSDISNGMTCDPTATENLTPVKLVKNGRLQDCYINLNGKSPTDIEIVTQATSGDNAPYIHKATLQTAVAFLNSLKQEDLDMDAIDGIRDTNEPDPSQDAEPEPSCASRAGELGWILCPLIKGAGDLLQGFFEGWIEPFLQIDAELLSGRGGVFQAWQSFQIIANLAFVVIFLFVIFSQLTGFGIDNYGIKKVLPKLIIGAILINLSYIICQLAVDLSNIFGHAMKGLFSNIAPYTSQIEIRVNGGENTGLLEAGAVTLTVIVGALVVQKVLTMGIMVIIPILIMVLTLLFSLFFLFFMLGLRQALAIILVAISPVAFVCYILPNTKSLFKKWTDLFKAMLLAYPIASAMVYGGDMVSRILIMANADAGSTAGAIESLGLLVTAAIVSIAPVFAIPGLLKKSLSAIDGVGGMLGKIQGGTRSGARKIGDGVRDSRVGNHMQEWQNSRNKAREDNRNLRRAGLRRNADGTVSLTQRGIEQNRKAARLGNTAGGRAYRRRVAESRNAAIGSISADNNMGRILTAGGVAATLAGMNTKQSQQEIADEIVNMATETGNYDLSQMESQLLDLTTRNDLSDDDVVHMKALISKMSETGFGAKSVANILSGRTVRRDQNGQVIQMNQATRKTVADYMASTDAASKVGNKDMYVAQYMRDVSAGNVGSNVSFDDWAVSQRADGTTNVEFVAKEILNDDELLAKQSTSSLQRTMDVDQMHSSGDVESGIFIDSAGNERKIKINITDKDAVSSGRAKKIIENENIHTKEEQDNLLGLRASGQQVRQINPPTPPPSP